MRHELQLMNFLQKPLYSHEKCQKVTELHHTESGSLIWCQLLVLTLSAIAIQCFCWQGDTASEIAKFLCWVRESACLLCSVIPCWTIQNCRGTGGKELISVSTSKTSFNTISVKNLMTLDGRDNTGVNICLAFQVPILRVPSHHQMSLLCTAGRVPKTKIMMTVNKNEMLKDWLGWIRSYKWTKALSLLPLAWWHHNLCPEKRTLYITLSSKCHSRYPIFFF